MDVTPPSHTRRTKVSLVGAGVGAGVSRRASERACFFHRRPRHGGFFSPGWTLECPFKHGRGFRPGVQTSSSGTGPRILPKNLLYFNDWLGVVVEAVIGTRRASFVLHGFTLRLCRAVTLVFVVFYVQNNDVVKRSTGTTEYYTSNPLRHGFGSTTFDFFTGSIFRHLYVELMLFVNHLD